MAIGLGEQCASHLKRRGLMIFCGLSKIISSNEVDTVNYNRIRYLLYNVLIACFSTALIKHLTDLWNCHSQKVPMKDERRLVIAENAAMYSRNE